MSAIAFVGASSQIAKDLIRSFVQHGRTELLLYVRNLPATTLWLKETGLDHACSVHAYDQYGELAHDAVINFVGVGDPRRAAEMGASIFDVTRAFDDMVLANLTKTPNRRYLFLSSGAVYGNNFMEPANDTTEAHIAINHIGPQDYYATAKLHAEVRHRANPHLAIIDLRVFNYFSRTQDIEARFLITDIVRAIRDGQVLKTTADRMVRDYLHPYDFYQLVTCILAAPPSNCAVDCFSLDTIDEQTLLGVMQQQFGLNFETPKSADPLAVNTTGLKPNYYSLSRKAANFGYLPRFSSQACVLTETAAIFEKIALRKTMEISHDD